ncbi:MAG: mechanosensitive ion channel [Clostridia bacterium]|nr:mechanosensitive ion channel [Clostridia bacterium]
MAKFATSLLAWAGTFITKLGISVLVVILSYIFINVLLKKIEKKCAKHKIDSTLTRTFLHIGGVLLKCLVVVVMLGYLGVENSSIAALFASLGVGLGLAVNGALSNLAGSVLLAVARPFHIGDYIEALDSEGTVDRINITHTKIVTFDQKVVYLPNGMLSGHTIINYSEKHIRRLDVPIYVSFGADFDGVKRMMLEICRSHPLVLDTPPVSVRITEQTGHAIKVVAQVWVCHKDYYTALFDILEQVQKQCITEQIPMPTYPISVFASPKKQEGEG